MAETNTNVIMTPEMLELLVAQILGKVNERIAGRIVNTISDTADVNHVPSALAVFNFLRTVTPNMSSTVVEGELEDVTNPDPTTIYLKQDPDDGKYHMYVKTDDGWVDLGTTDVDLTNYWSKSEQDVALLREEILNNAGIDKIKTQLNYAYLLKNDDASKALILSWIEGSVSSAGANMDEIVAAVLEQTDDRYVLKSEMPSVITESQITAAVAAASAATDPAI